MKVLGLIPARGGSKGVLGKNLRRVGGLSLIEWTARSAHSSKLHRIILSTDSSEIAAEGTRCGIEVPFLRPAEFATDVSLSVDVVNHALDALDENFDAVALLQPTSPFRSALDIDACLGMMEDSDADSVISVKDTGELHPSRMKYLVDGCLIDPPFAEDVEGMPRQGLQPMFLRNGAVYLTRTTTIRSGSLRGRYSLGYVMPEERSVNIDTEFDLLIAEAVFRQYFC